MITEATAETLITMTCDLPLIVRPLAQHLMLRSVDLDTYGRAVVLAVLSEIAPPVELGALGDALGVVHDIGMSQNKSSHALRVAQKAWTACGKDRAAAAIAFAYMSKVRGLCDADAGMMLH
jgi:hypothetical protein